MSFFILYSPKQVASQDPDNRDVEHLALPRFIGTLLSRAHPDYRDHADAYIIGHE